MDQHRARHFLVPFSTLSKLVVTLMMCLAIGAHNVIVALFNAPPNALSFAYHDLIYSYVPPLFYQNWSFFAPEPIDRDVYLLARAVRSDGSATAWTNVSQPFISALQQNRLSSKEILVTGISNTLLDTLRDNTLTQLVQSRRTRQLDAIQGPHILYRLGAAVLAREYYGQQFTGIQVAVEQSEFPRFTHRFEKRSMSKPISLVLPVEQWPKSLSRVPW